MQSSHNRKRHGTWLPQKSSLPSPSGQALPLPENTVKGLPSAVLGQLTEVVNSCSSGSGSDAQPLGRTQATEAEENEVALTGTVLSVEAILGKPSFQEKSLERMLDPLSRKASTEANEIPIPKATAGENICAHLTRARCRRARLAEQIGGRTPPGQAACRKVHFRRIVFQQTDLSLGDCSFLDKCNRLSECPYVHYELDPRDSSAASAPRKGKAASQAGAKDSPESAVAVGDRQVQEHKPSQPQFINCDLSTTDLSLFGKFDVVLMDPPWEIQMNVPYSTVPDAEIEALKVENLCGNGYVFLWVTGRAMELGRRCLSKWGFTQVDEIVWAKINQVKTLGRSGRTGYWLNHSKEHCLVGACGKTLVALRRGGPDPKAPAGEAERSKDCNVIVSEVREGSRKPDELYGMIERLAPRGRYIELFGRRHNARPGWVTLGNQPAETAAAAADTEAAASGDKKMQWRRTPEGQWVRSVASSSSSSSADERLSVAQKPQDRSTASPTPPRPARAAQTTESSAQPRARQEPPRSGGRSGGAMTAGGVWVGSKKSSRRGGGARPKLQPQEDYFERSRDEQYDRERPLRWGQRAAGESSAGEGAEGTWGYDEDGGGRGGDAEPGWGSPARPAAGADGRRGDGKRKRYRSPSPELLYCSKL